MSAKTCHEGLSERLRLPWRKLKGSSQQVRLCEDIREVNEPVMAPCAREVRNLPQS